MLFFASDLPQCAISQLTQSANKFHNLVVVLQQQAWEQRGQAAEAERRLLERKQAEAAVVKQQALARKADWPELYDEAQLARNEVPVAAAVYVEDLFVEHGLSMETARKIQGLRAFQTMFMNWHVSGPRTGRAGYQ